MFSSHGALVLGVALPERGASTQASGDQLQHWYVAALDEVDYGMLVVDAELRVHHWNHAARVQIGKGSALSVRAGQLCPRLHADTLSLAKAVRDAVQRGRRCLLRLSVGAAALVTTVVPLSEEGALIVLPKPEPCGALALQWFASHHRLTRAEERVLRALCAGDKPAEVARCHDVALSTVRTQIAYIRQKTGASTIGALLRQVSALPPSVCALRQVSG